LPSGKARVGSGYLVADRLVLTAGHVVDGAARGSAIDVKFPAADAAATGVVLWSGSAEGLDAALVELNVPPKGRVRIRVGAVRWGRLTGQRPGVEATAVGFPRALKDTDGMRVPDQVDGAINPGAGFGERYDLNLSGAHPLVAAEDPSPWAGLSGAALYCDALLAGVVVIDTPNFQSGRLTAVPTWRLLANADFATALGRHGCEQQWESVELAALFEHAGGRLDSPASLLRADNAVVRFRGRDQLLEDLWSWAEGADDLAGMLLIGAGGQGKTRLARELCQQLRSEGWVVGFVRREWDSARASRLTDSRFPVLAVVDYTETRVEHVRELVRAAADATVSVRALLLARSAGEWWQQLQRELRSRVSLAQPVVLPPLEDAPDGRRDAYCDALGDLASALARLPDRADTDWQARARTLKPPDLSAGAYATILTIQLQALTDLLAAAEDERDGTLDGPETDGSRRPEELEDVLLEHEQTYWERTAAREGLVKPNYQPITLKRAVATATVCGAADEDDAIRTVTRIPGLGDKTTDERRGVARWLGDLYPAGAGRYWGSLQPDRVGEHLIGQVTRDKADLLPAVLDGASEEQLTLALTVLARAAGHQPHIASVLRELLTARLPIMGPLTVPVAIAAARPQPVIDALRQAVLNATDPEELHSLHDALPPQSLLLGSLAVDLTTRLVTLYRPLADVNPDAFLPRLANSMNSHSVMLSRVGRPEDALAAIEEAVEIRRRLASVRPDAFLPDLASSLSNQSRCLGELGRREDALAANEEAVETYRGLAAADPDAFLPDLAKSLNNQSGGLSGLGRREDALAASEEAVETYRGLVAADPDAFLPGLAMSLNNLSVRLNDLRRHDDALVAIEEAVTINRRLAEAGPDAFLPDLAKSINLRSVQLNARGCHDEALEAIDEAVTVYRRLAEARPDAFLPDLAGALNNQCGWLSAQGRDDEALVAIDEAVTVYRRLAEARPDAFLPVFARALSNKSIPLSALGRHDEALEAIDEAVTVYRRLAEARPDVFLPDLARALNNRTGCLSDLRRHEEALEAIEEAVTIYRRLAAARPDVFLPELAGALNNQSVPLSALGRHDEAIAAAQQAIDLY
jgi:tetratricopeptide (TPR) repeat protein